MSRFLWFTVYLLYNERECVHVIPPSIFLP